MTQQLINKLDEVEKLLKHQPGRHDQGKHAPGHRMRARGAMQAAMEGKSMDAVVNHVMNKVGGKTQAVQLPSGMKSFTSVVRFEGNKTGAIGKALRSVGFKKTSDKVAAPGTESYSKGKMRARVRYRKSDNDTRFEVQDTEAASGSK